MNSNLNRYSSVASGLIFVLAAIFFGGAAIWASMLQQNKDSNLFLWGFLAVLLMLLAEAGWRWSKKSWSVEAEKSILSSGTGASSKVASSIGFMGLAWNMLVAIFFLIIIVFGAIKISQDYMAGQLAVSSQFYVLIVVEAFYLILRPLLSPVFAKISKQRTK